MSEILRSQGHPDQALQVFEPLLDSIINDELWLQALLCEGEAPPRGLGARDRVMALWRRYESRLRDLGLYPSTGSEDVYKTLLGATRVADDKEERRTKFVVTDHTNRQTGDGRTDGGQWAVRPDVSGTPAIGLAAKDAAHAPEEPRSERPYADRAAAYRQFTVTFAGRTPRSTVPFTTASMPRCGAKVAGGTRPALATAWSSSKITQTRSRL